VKRHLLLAYGLFAYACFGATVLYFIGFLGNVVVPRAMDAEPTATPLIAAAINLGLIALFGVQHSVMARPAFKRAWTNLVPEPAERSTYVLFSCLALAVLFWLWQPVGPVLWNVQEPVMRSVLFGLFAGGWVMIVVASIQINHFDLFGLRQVWLHWKGTPYTPLRLGTPGFYKHVRHPLYVGWLTAFWVSPTMTAGHALFAAGMTAYILIAIVFEERNLREFHGEPYAEYRRRTPMFIPRLRKPQPDPIAVDAAAEHREA
jgi:protein-S-isoprenylcysteine O-methyltransferase Ste14